MICSRPGDGIGKRGSHPENLFDIELWTKKYLYEDVLRDDDGWLNLNG